MTTTPATCYVVTTGISGFDLEVDTIIYASPKAKQLADKHAKELKAMGCDAVRVRPFANAAAAEAYEDKVRGY